MINEYFNPTPVSIPYRGHENKLFKRDFAGELIDSYSLKLVDYGFVYSRDNLYPQDDMTWFLLEKLRQLKKFLIGQIRKNKVSLFFFIFYWILEIFFL